MVSRMAISKATVDTYAFTLMHSFVGCGALWTCGGVTEDPERVERDSSGTNAEPRLKPG